MKSELQKGSFFTIRPFRKEDTAVVAVIAHRAWQPIFQGFIQQIGEEMMRLTRPDYKTSKRDWVYEAAEKYPESMIVCEREGRVVGFLYFLMNKERKIGTISNNAADPDYQGTGIGQELYAAVFEIFRKNGMAVAQVVTGLDDGHAPARCAYERAGFKERLPQVVYYKKLD